MLGVGLPSLTCGHALVGAKQVTITERCEELDTLVNLKDIVTLNGLDSTCTVQSLSWDQPQTWPTESCDFILGSVRLFIVNVDCSQLVLADAHAFNKQTCRMCFIQQKILPPLFLLFPIYSP